MKTNRKSRAFAVRKRAFTLIELILSLFIATIVMSGVCSLMFDMTGVLKRFEYGENFELHCDGVENFLNRTFAKTTIAKSVPPRSFSSNNTDDLISFSVDEDVPPFIARRGFSPEKSAWLMFKEDAGLFLIWYFKTNENVRGVSSDYPIYEFCISEYVSKLEYVYIDSDGKWQYEEDMQDPQYSTFTPTFLKITFKNGKKIVEKFVRLSNNRSAFFTWESSNTSQSAASQGRTNDTSNLSGASGNGGGRQGQQRRGR